jgi:hypothetical protein
VSEKQFILNFSSRKSLYFHSTLQKHQPQTKEKREKERILHHGRKTLPGRAELRQAAGWTEDLVSYLPSLQADGIQVSR